jgi:hypothetical protein
MRNEIVGLLINGSIISGFGALYAARANNCEIERIITRDIAHFMAGLDLGANWEQLAKAETILILDNKGIRLPDGFYTNDLQEIFEIKDGVKTILDAKIND